MIPQAPAWSTPTRAQAAGFWLRTRGHVLLHGLRGCFGGRSRRWRAGNTLAAASVVAQWRSPLWPSEPESEFILTAGKVHNLRLAAKAFDGLEIPAGETLSFWRQLGRPARSRGFVAGREVRAGCIIPTIAGGICQLSNALATCAHRAGFELIERHAHSMRAGAGEGEPLDATVFWNYVDLRIRAPVAWRIELTLTATELVLALRVATGNTNPGSINAATVASTSALARSCLNCDQADCFRHRSLSDQGRARTAWLLDDAVPEFERWLQTQAGSAERMRPITPHASIGRLLRRRPAKTTADSPERVRRGRWRALRLVWIGWRRAAWLRLHANQPGKRQASVLDGQRWLARAYGRDLRPEHTHLVVDQGLLPHLLLQGALGGRTYDVLARALPMDEIQRRLDQAGARAGDPETSRAALRDFRAPDALLRAELAALRGARRLITAHTDVAAHWSSRAPGLAVRLLSWDMPTSVASRGAVHPPLVVFPASALARKGAGELAEALRGLPCRLRILGSAASDPLLWRGIALEQGHYRDDWLSHAAVVVLPAHVEHAPRALLQAIAAGVPVITTPACGISNLAGVHLTPAGDAAALRALLQRLLCDDLVESTIDVQHAQTPVP
ncbi:VanW family protein [Dyella sp.]|jgi:hypothetical protein|uniref:VanW family protein n=1 Tax=Dyella sp. TaxID=1869338 RepID=UPI002D7949BA|nr:VanW family protein [Dyella sp.]HET6431839.1 VanW family protein [Dyella sp.]